MPEKPIKSLSLRLKAHLFMAKRSCLQEPDNGNITADIKIKGTVNIDELGLLR